MRDGALNTLLALRITWPIVILSNPISTNFTIYIIKSSMHIVIPLEMFTMAVFEHAVEDLQRVALSPV